MILLVLCLARFGRSQTAATIIGQNFCNNLQGINDNLSCADDPIEGQACFTRDNLCNGVSLCPGQEDEGSDATLSSLECRHLRVLGYRSRGVLDHFRVVVFLLMSSRGRVLGIECSTPGCWNRGVPLHTD